MGKVVEKKRVFGVAFSGAVSYDVPMTSTDTCPICHALRLFTGATHICAGPKNDVITLRERQEMEWAAADARHAAACQLPVPACHICADHFGMVPV